MSTSVFDQPKRLALAINADGERWIATIPDIGYVPRTMVRNGRAYTLLMTMSVEHLAFANRWAATR